MRYLITVSSALLIAWGAFLSPAMAEIMCGDREEVIDSLENVHKESPISMGLAVNGTVVEVFSSKKGTFTIIMTHPNGLSCLVTAGEFWETLPVRNVNTKI